MTKRLLRYPLKSVETSFYPNTHQCISLQNIQEHLGVRALIDQEIQCLHRDLDDSGELHIEDFIFI
jgi:hypothetical protein